MERDIESKITTVPKYPIKGAIVIGNITFVPLNKSIVRRLGITEQTFFQQEQLDEGIYLRIVKEMELKG